MCVPEGQTHFKRMKPCASIHLLTKPLLQLTQGHAKLAARCWYHGYNNNNVNTSYKIDKTLQVLVLSSNLLSLHSNLLGFLPGFSPRHLTNFHETTGSVFYGVVFWWGSSKNTNTCQHYALMKQTKPGQMYRLQIIRNLMQHWTQVLFLSQPHSQPLTLQPFIIYCKRWKLG